MPNCCPTCIKTQLLTAGKVEEKEELKNLLMWGTFSFDVIVDGEIFTYVKNKIQLIFIVNKKFQIANGAVWSNSLSLIVWNNTFGVDVPLTEKPGC